MTTIFAADDFDLTEDAPAKINLALHVTGQRADGYHLLDMLVTFTGHGDRLGFCASEHDVFSLFGRFSPLLGPEADAGGNLVLRARDLLRQAALQAGLAAPPVHIHLEKNLPVASGIGGGSADAAATLRGLARLWGLSLPPDEMTALALKLGADVPMCLASRPLIARGIGEAIELLPDFPSFAMVLGNPLVGVSTPEVFRHLARKNNPALALSSRRSNDRTRWIEIMAGLRNDLEPPARALCGEIAVLSQMITDEGALTTRMSGSGATCFGLFDDPEQATAAASALHRRRPDWYFQATETIGGDA
ncbi:MAG: 4-(cytidine 5'-diphospho)-2-C-methyl-D-erythritol kinase [Rhizobium sp.]